jgi:hypothetical protein
MEKAKHVLWRLHGEMVNDTWWQAVVGLWARLIEKGIRRKVLRSLWLRHILPRSPPRSKDAHRGLWKGRKRNRKILYTGDAFHAIGSSVSMSNCMMDLFRYFSNLAGLMWCNNFRPNVTSQAVPFAKSPGGRARVKDKLSFELRRGHEGCGGSREKGREHSNSIAKSLH